MSTWLTRRRFIALTTALLPGALLGWSFGPRHRSLAKPGPHPEPRPGITAAKVPTPEQLQEASRLIPLFDRVREIPQIMDGIGCQCCWDEAPYMYSLLSGYEGSDAMAKVCESCQAQGRLVTELHKQGKSLNEIRAAIDARSWSGGLP